MYYDLVSGFDNDSLAGEWLCVFLIGAMFLYDETQYVGMGIKPCVSTS